MELMEDDSGSDGLVSIVALKLVSKTLSSNMLSLKFRCLLNHWLVMEVVTKLTPHLRQPIYAQVAFLLSHLEDKVDL